MELIKNEKSTEIVKYKEGIFEIIKKNDFKNFA